MTLLIFIAVSIWKIPSQIQYFWNLKEEESSAKTWALIYQYQTSMSEVTGVSPSLQGSEAQVHE